MLPLSQNYSLLSRATPRGILQTFAMQSFAILLRVRSGRQGSRC
jgi:hypothetical protein